MTTQNVTDRNSALCNAESADVPAERETARFRLSTLHSAITDRDDRPVDSAAWIKRFGAYFTPPAVLAEQAPAVDQIKAYAHRAAWTSRTDGPVRAVGIGWCYLIAIPMTVWSRIREWVWQRPARALVVLVTVKALTFLPPVGWLVDHLIKPAVRFALWLFL